MSVMFLHLRAKGLGGVELGVVELSALTQIADVVLVHDESALEDDVRSRGLVKLVGYSVQAYDGTPLGKVRPQGRSQICGLLPFWLREGEHNIRPNRLMGYVSAQPMHTRGHWT